MQVTTGKILKFFVIKCMRWMMEYCQNTRQKTEYKKGSDKKNPGIYQQKAGMPGLFCV